MSGPWSLRRTRAAIHRRQIALVVVEVVLAIAAPSAVIALLANGYVAAESARLVPSRS